MSSETAEEAVFLSKVPGQEVKCSESATDDVICRNYDDVGFCYL